MKSLDLQLIDLITQHKLNIPEKALECKLDEVSRDFYLLSIEISPTFTASLKVAILHQRLEDELNALKCRLSNDLIGTANMEAFLKIHGIEVIQLLKAFNGSSDQYEIIATLLKDWRGQIVGKKYNV